jgi:hypothetical protein
MQNHSSSDLGKLWWTVLILIVLPLYALAVALVIRSHVFAFGHGTLSAGDVRQLWAFLASGVTASVALVGLLFTRSHNQRTLALQREAEKQTLALQREAEKRLVLETVVKGLDLVAPTGTYAPSAKIAGALAALVHLDHPVIAMRTLGAAWGDGVVDNASAVWLINEVFGSRSEQSQLEAAILLDIHAPDLCADAPGNLSWPMSIEFEWPSDMRLDTRLHVFRAVLRTLTSKPLDWWSKGGRAGWALSLLDEVIRKDPDGDVQGEAAVAARIILPVVKLVTLQYGGSWKPIEDVRSRVEAVDRRARIILTLKPLQEKLADWGECCESSLAFPEFTNFQYIAAMAGLTEHRRQFIEVR